MARKKAVVPGKPFRDEGMTPVLRNMGFVPRLMC